MAKINLLPWREAYRKEKKREFLVILGGVVVIAALLSLLWVLIVQSQIDNQNSRNQRLETEIATLEKQVSEIGELKKKRDDLITRIKVIQDLQGTRPFIVHYFDELARATPENVYLTSVIRKGDEFTIEGIAESITRISSIMRSLDASPWFKNSNMISFNAMPSEGEQAQAFKITSQVEAPDEKVDGVSSSSRNSSTKVLGGKK